MKKILFLLPLFFLCTISFAQDDKLNTCSHAKSQIQAKSGTLTIEQIAQTELYDVHYYFLNLNVTNTSANISGEVTIISTALTTLDTALLELNPAFTINSIEVDGVTTAYNRNATALMIPLNVVSGDLFTIKVNYSGLAPSPGFHNVGGISVTLSEPFYSYNWFPVKQSLKDKADSCDVWVTVPGNCKAGSNGILQQVIDNGSTKRYEWRHRHPIAYYLISIAVAPYTEYITTAYPAGSGPVPIQCFVFSNPAWDPAYQAQIDKTADFMELFSDLFGPYPYADEKYGVCLMPSNGGGMENQTMTTMSSFDVSLNAHELAHQWWGDHVTCKSWADIWVNEGFAEYSEYLMQEEFYPAEQQNSMTNHHIASMLQPGGSVWVEDTLSMGSIFSGLVYSKGAAIIHTLRYLIDNDALFFNGLRDYQEIFADSVASALDFIHVMENASGRDFTNFMEEWFYGEGYPTYSVKWNNTEAGLLLEISQSTSSPGSVPFFTNDVSLRIQSPGVPETTIRLSVESNPQQYLLPDAEFISQVLSIDPDNFIINKVGTIVKDPGFLELNKNSDELKINVYPNPVKNIVTIEMPVEDDYSVSVTDAKGAVINSFEFSSVTTIDFSEKTAGYYILQIKSSDGTQVRKLLKVE